MLDVDGDVDRGALSKLSRRRRMLNSLHLQAQCLRSRDGKQAGLLVTGAECRHRYKRGGNESQERHNNEVFHNIMSKAFRRPVMAVETVVVSRLAVSLKASPIALRVNFPKKGAAAYR